jgi:hypothetical protein
MRHVKAAGIGWRLARVWSGTRALERRLKVQGGHARKCPLCGVTPRRDLAVVALERQAAEVF